LNRVNAELKRLQRGGVTKKESKQARRLKGQQARLNEQLETIQDTYVSQVESIFNAQEALQQAAIDDINNDASRKTGKLDRVRRVASAIGNNAAITAANQAQRGVLQEQADRIKQQIGAARKRGNHTLADQLVDQVEDLRVQIFESIQAELREGVEAINKKAQRRLSGIDLGNRILDAVGTVGLKAGAAALGGASRGNLFEARGNVLNTQRTELQAALRLAEALGNMGLVEELTDQLAELNVTIMENTAAYFNARFEDINATASFANQINDLNKQVVELTADIAGTTNTPALIGLAEQRTGILQTQRTDLQGLLAEAYATGNQKNINDLTVALLENQVALLQNTKIINELQGTIKSPQTFSSSAWQQFRQAIFDGNSGLRPQYAVPQSATGGYVASQTGSTMIPSTRPANYDSKVQYNDIDVNMSHPVEDVSGVEIGNRVAWSLKTENTEI
jgi:Mg2+ and Co2+ transporter CorA